LPIGVRAVDTITASLDNSHLIPATGGLPLVQLPDSSHS